MSGTPHIADAETDFFIISVTPDMCRVGKKVIAFEPMQKLTHQRYSYAKSVFSRDAAVLKVGSVVEGLTGNAGKGIHSGVAAKKGHSIVIPNQSSVWVEDRPVASHNDAVLMNGPIESGSSSKQGDSSAAAVSEAKPKPKTPKGGSRSMTEGEIEMAKRVFGDSIDYTKVKVHNGEYWMFFGLQGNNIAAPNGEIYFPGNYFLEDFSKADGAYQRLFVHEMGHVWQYQEGYPVRLTKIFNPFMPYEYTLSPGLKLSDFNMEQQADILADYYASRSLGIPALISVEQYRNNPEYPGLLDSTLSDFFKDPKNPNNLPKLPNNSRSYDGGGG